MDDSALVDRIYEAPAFPDAWRSVLDDIGGRIDAHANGVAIWQDNLWFGARYSTWLGPTLDRYVRTGAMRQSQFMPRTGRLNHPGFLRDRDVYQHEGDFLADPLMAEFFTPIGLRHPAATLVRLPTGETAVVEFWRRLEQPPFEAEAIAWLDGLRPHLCRAVLLAGRWRLERLRAGVEALALLALPAAMLNRAGRVLAANTLIADLRSCIAWLPGDRIALKNKGADALLHRAVADTAPPSSSAPRSIPCRGGGEAWIAHLIPVAGIARDVFVGADSLLILTPVSPDVSPPPDAVPRALFDLTPAEARVARGIGEGFDLSEISRRHGGSRETVRTQAKAVYAKTGTGGKSQLVRLLSSLTSVPVG